MSADAQHRRKEVPQTAVYPAEEVSDAPPLDGHERGFDRWITAILPAALLIVSVFILPIILLAANSFHRHTTLGQVSSEFTLENYRLFLTDPFYLEILGRTFLLGAVVVTICTLLGYPV